MTIVVIEHIVSRREFGVIFSGRDETGATVRIKASNDAAIGIPEVGEIWSVEGEVERTPWGPQIKASRATRSLPNGDLIVDYLSSSVAGIGPTRARRLWKHFAETLPRSPRHWGR
jgi:exodeoxyribonuclease V alpha subunit